MFSNPTLVKFAKLLTHHGVCLKAGELVAINGDIEALPLLREVYKEALKLGAIPVLHISDPAMSEIFYKEAKAIHLDKINPIRKFETQKLDASIMVMASTNLKSGTNVNPKIMQRLGKTNQSIRDKMMKRSADGTFKWVLTQYPTQAYAQESEMSFTDYSDFVFKALKLHKPDPIKAWKELGKKMKVFQKKLAKKTEFHVQGKGIDLKFSTKGMAWIPCDGRMNLPDGEIFTAPKDGTIEGYYTVSYPACYAGREVAGVRLEFEKGTCTKMSATKNEDFLIKTLNTDPGAKRPGEFAINLNYDIKQFSKSILFDEKIGGGIHLALGMAYPECGGTNKSAVHWDFVTDMRKGTIHADGKLVYKNGKPVGW
jgi:aminopeptidase